MRRKRNSKRLALLFALIMFVSLLTPIGSVFAEEGDETDNSGSIWTIHYDPGTIPEYDSSVNGNMEDQIIEDAENLTVKLTTNSFSREGYAFTGWSNTPEGEDIADDPETEDMNESVQDFTVLLDNEQELTDWTFTRDAEEYDISYAFDDNRELTLYAQWNEVEISTTEEPTEETAAETENTVNAIESDEPDLVIEEDPVIEEEIDPVADGDDSSSIPIHNPREKVSSDILSGTWGSCPWRITSDGVLTIGAGTGTNLSGNVSGSPWYSKRGNITMIRAEGGVVFPENVAYLFKECVACTTVDLSGCDTSNVVNMSHLFDGSYNITSVNLSGFNTEKVENMSYLFYNCSAIPEIDLSSFKTSSVTDMSYFFYYCESLTSIDVSHFDTGNVTSMYYMFYHCELLKTLDVTNFDVKNLQSMGFMFAGCKGLTTIDLSNFFTENLNVIRGAFYDCSNLVYLDLSAFITDGVTDFYALFYNCSSMTSVDLSSFNMRNGSAMAFDYFFHDCNKMKRVKIGPNYFSRKNSGEDHLPYGTYALWYSENGLYGPYMPMNLQSIFLDSEENASAMSGWWRIEGDGYQINFDPNGGTGEMVTQNVLTNTYTDLNSNQFTKDRYDFVEWNTQTDGSGEKYSDGEYIYNLAETEGSITLYAQWKKQTGSIVLSSKVTGTSATNIPFTFKIHLADDQDNSVSAAFGDYTFINGDLSLTLYAGQNIEIDEIPFDYSYQIKQPDIPSGYTAVQSEYKGTIVEKETVDAIFENQYSASGTANIEAEVILCGTEDLSRYSFPFEITDTFGNVVSSGSSGQDGKVVFEPITYSMSDNGQSYTYSVNQLSTGLAGIKIGTNQKTVSVSVSDNSDGTMNTKIMWNEGSNLFINQLNIGSLPETGKTSWMQLLLMCMTIVLMMGIAAAMTKEKNKLFKL